MRSQGGQLLVAAHQLAGFLPEAHGVRSLLCGQLPNLKEDRTWHESEVSSTMACVILPALW